MIKIRISGVGKTKEEWLDSAIQEYIKRMSPTAQIEFAIYKDDRSLLESLESFVPISYITLDENGKQYSSPQFSQFLQHYMDTNGPRLHFVIGGAEGLPPSLKSHALQLSLSSMTLTHQMVRLLLIEQIYRALEIQRGSRYHK